jgi:hypothetical protein
VALVPDEAGAFEAPRSLGRPILHRLQVGGRENEEKGEDSGGQLSHLNPPYGTASAVRAILCGWRIEVN